jgi:hypothetical protein
MAQTDVLDTALEELAQRLADLSLVVNTIREFRRNANRLRQPLADELRSVQVLITQVVGLL